MQEAVYLGEIASRMRRLARHVGDLCEAEAYLRLAARFEELAALAAELPDDALDVLVSDFVTVLLRGD